MVMTGDDEENPFCDEQAVEIVSGFLIFVEAVLRQERVERFMEEHKFVSEGFLQLGLEPGKLFPRDPSFLFGKLCVEKNKKRVSIGERIIWLRKETHIHRERVFAVNVMIPRREMERFVRSCKFKKPCPLACAAGGAYGISRMDDEVDLLLFHFAHKGRVDRIIPGPDVRIADDSEGYILLSLDKERNEKKSKGDNQ
jgi:hypothetical protein